MNSQIKPKLFKVLIRENIHVPLVELIVQPNDTVSRLKRRIMMVKCKDEHTTVMSLFHRKHLLKNEEALMTDFKIKDNSIIDYQLDHVTGGMIFIKRSDTNQIFSVDYKRGDTIKTIKEKISKLLKHSLNSLFLSAFMLNFKKNEVNMKLLEEDMDVFFACTRCRNQMFLTIDKLSLF